jgi:hypothetical protein
MLQRAAAVISRVIFICSSPLVSPFDGLNWTALLFRSGYHAGQMWQSRPGQPVWINLVLNRSQQPTTPNLLQRAPGLGSVPKSADGTCPGIRLTRQVESLPSCPPTGSNRDHFLHADLSEVGPGRKSWQPTLFSRYAKYLLTDF